MAIITISRGCSSHGKEVAEKVAAMLGYRTLSREALIEEASQIYHVPEKELIKSIHDAPSVLNRLTRGKEQYLMYIQSVLLGHAKYDNLVYHGNASHLLLPEITHVLKVRIIAEISDRIALMQKRQQIGEKEALRHIQAEDAQISKWANYLYKIDITDPYIYDIIVHIKSLSVEDACRMICFAAEMDDFRATPESTQAIADLALSSQIKAAIENTCKSDIKVSVTTKNGIAHIRAETRNIRKTGYTNPKTEKYIKEKSKQEITDEISAAIAGIPDVKNVVYEVAPPNYA